MDTMKIPIRFVRNVTSYVWNVIATIYVLSATHHNIEPSII